MILDWKFKDKKKTYKEFQKDENCELLTLINIEKFHFIEQRV